MVLSHRVHNITGNTRKGHQSGFRRERSPFIFIFKYSTNLNIKVKRRQTVLFAEPEIYVNSAASGKDPLRLRVCSQTINDKLTPDVLTLTSTYCCTRLVSCRNSNASQDHPYRKQLLKQHYNTSLPGLFL